MKRSASTSAASDALTREKEMTALRLAHVIGLMPRGNLASRLPANIHGSSRLLATSLLFQGPNPSSKDSGELHQTHRAIPSAPTAISMNGLCFCEDILRFLSSDAKSFGTVHIIPGYVSYQDHRYDAVRNPNGDHQRFDMDGTGAQIPADDFHTMPSARLDVSVEARVKELNLGGELQFFYKLTASCATIF